MNNRYNGRPFLRLLECFVLRSIGELTEKHGIALERMAPKLQQTFGRSGEWHEIVAAEMEFPATLPQELKQLWEQSVKLSRESGAPLDPEAFARNVIDVKFSSDGWSKKTWSA